MTREHKRLTLACYTSSMSMSIVANLPPLLFLTFRDLYGISYSLLGLLVVVNFVTQLIIDLLFSFFSHRFPIGKVVKLTPAITILGFGIYAAWPYLFPDAVYPGLVLGTVVFSASSGFSEVLTSPVIASIPSDDPDRAMSRLHSTYAWGVVLVVGITTLFQVFVGLEYWPLLAGVLMLLPLCSFFLFHFSTIPELETPEQVTGVLRFLKTPVIWLLVFMIFMGGAAECTMAQWASGYLEQALGIEKIWGDIFGVALFSLMLGLGRSLYGKFGKNIHSILLLGFCGAAICYLVAAVSSAPLVGLLACGLTGFCASMLWPGSLIAATDLIPQSGVVLFAMMAAGGDLGASVGPQLVGVITDTVIASPALQQLALQMGMLPSQFGMKLGLLTGMLFPLVGIPVCLKLRALYKMKGRS